MCVNHKGGVRGILGSPFLPWCYHSDSFRFVKMPWSMVAFLLGLTNWLWSQNYKIYLATQFSANFSHLHFTKGSINVLLNWSQEFLSCAHREINWGYSQQKFHKPAQCQMDQWSPISRVRRRYMEAAFYHRPNVWDHICYQSTHKIWELHFREYEKYSLQFMRIQFT